MKSKTKISKQTERKSDSELVETIRLAKKSKAWFAIANILSGPRKNRAEMNLSEIDKNSNSGDFIVIPGKVLSQGEISKKIKISAIGFSEKAKEKLLNSKIEISYIQDEIKKSPEAKGIKILK